MGESSFLFVLYYFYVVSVLHPHHKLEYFKKHNWDDAWVETASNLVQRSLIRHVPIWTLKLVVAAFNQIIMRW
jgi:hypothetical protein